MAHAIAVDGSGNVYVGGLSECHLGLAGERPRGEC